MDEQTQVTSEQQTTEAPPVPETTAPAEPQAEEPKEYGFWKEDGDLPPEGAVAPPEDQKLNTGWVELARRERVLKDQWSV